MAIVENQELATYCEEVARRAKAASARLATLPGAIKNDWLKTSAKLLRESTDSLLEANQRDIAAAPDFGLTDAQTDRLRLSAERIEAIAVALEEITMLPDPIGEIIESSVRPNGLEVSKIRVPLGVVFFVYETRPNVTADAAAICVKSGNAVILRGGKEAAHSSAAIVKQLAEAARRCELPADAVQLVETTDREAVGNFLRLPQYIDVAIPRGGEGLIRRVAQEARMPVIKHFQGNCHVYVDAGADLQMAQRLVINSKCQRPGVCNACETLLVHADVAAKFLPQIGSAFADQRVEVRGDEQTCHWIPEAKEATDEDFATEFLAPVISVKVVSSLEAALQHIARFGSRHTEAIVTERLQAARQFVAGVDSAAVFVNASTRFNDGGQFGLGAEIGISTDKFHARGPCGLRELTSYKYVGYGNGQIRQ